MSAYPERIPVRSSLQVELHPTFVFVPRRRISYIRTEHQQVSLDKETSITTHIDCQFDMVA